MRVGITGASGMIGSRLFASLPNHNITALTRTLVAERKASRNVTWVQGDLLSLPDCQALVRDVDVVLHLAHKNSPMTSNRFLPEDAQLNLIGTLNLLEAVRQSGRRIHIIYASSGGAIYGRSPTRKPFTEDDVCLPISSYGIQKLAAEHYLRMWAARGYLSATVLRISNAYGATLSPERMQGLIGTAITQILQDRPVTLFGNPENVRDYVHIDDVLRVIELCLDRQADFEVFNIGANEGVTVLEVIELIQRCLGKKAIIQAVPSPEADLLTDWVVLDTSRAKRLLSWQPTVSLEMGIRRICQAIRC